MAEREEIRALYDAYIAQVEELERNRKPGDGLFGLGKSPADDPCHDRFADDLTAMLTAFAEAKPSSAEVREVLTFLYTVPREHREPKSAYWMLIAVHGLALELIGRLSREDAAALYAAYAKEYPRWERLPVQKKTLAALKEQRKA